MTTAAKSYRITARDIERALELDILKKIYHAYGGFGSSAKSQYQEEDERRSLIKLETLLVLKAFFLPATAIKNAPDKADIINTMRAAMVNTDFRTDVDEAAFVAREEARKLKPYVDPRVAVKDRPSMAFSGQSRRFDILTKHFGIDPEMVRKALYQICVANSSETEEEWENEQQKLSARRK